MCNIPIDESAFSVVSDANFLFHLLEALANAVENDFPDLSREAMFECFKERLNRMLDGVASRTMDGKFLVSSEVYEEEVCPTNPNSSLRRKLGCIDTMCQRLREKYQALEDCLLHLLEQVQVSNEHVHFLMQHFHAELRPKDRDASLLLLALKKSAQARTFLLTDDEPLTKACNHLIGEGQVVIACGTFGTSQLDQVRYMDFVKWAHDACYIDTDQFTSSFNFRLAIEYERLETVGPSGRRLKVKQFDKATYAYRQSVRMKGQLNSPQSPPQAI